MSKDNSPTYALGLVDGAADAAAVTSCPPRPAGGLRPPNPQYPWMYTKGYRDGYGDVEPHECTPECTKNDARMDAS